MSSLTKSMKGTLVNVAALSKEPNGNYYLEAIKAEEDEGNISIINLGKGMIKISFEEGADRNQELADFISNIDSRVQELASRVPLKGAGTLDNKLGPTGYDSGPTSTTTPIYHGPARSDVSTGRGSVPPTPAKRPEPTYQIPTDEEINAVRSRLQPPQVERGTTEGSRGSLGRKKGRSTTGLLDRLKTGLEIETRKADASVGVTIEKSGIEGILNGAFELLKRADRKVMHNPYMQIVESVVAAGLAYEFATKAGGITTPLAVILETGTITAIDIAAELGATRGDKGAIGFKYALDYIEGALGVAHIGYGLFLGLGIPVMELVSPGSGTATYASLQQITNLWGNNPFTHFLIGARLMRLATYERVEEKPGLIKSIEAKVSGLKDKSGELYEFGLFASAVGYAALHNNVPLAAILTGIYFGEKISDYSRYKSEHVHVKGVNVSKPVHKVVDGIVTGTEAAGGIFATGALGLSVINVVHQLPYASVDNFFKMFQGDPMAAVLSMLALFYAARIEDKEESAEAENITYPSNSPSLRPGAESIGH